MCIVLAVAAAPAGAQNARLIAPELDTYASARTLIDWPPGELIHKIHELKGLEPAENQDQLPSILREVGSNVEGFFRDFPNTTSVERIREERLGSLDYAHNVERFRYLLLSRSGAVNVLDEYRTDDQGRKMSPHGLRHGPSFVTVGFASMSAHFLPAAQAGSRFRLLGRQRRDGHETLAVAFAQRPDNARLTGEFNMRGESIVVLVQGVAWIDAATDQIVRMRTDLLSPRPDVGLDQETTDIRFGEVYFKKVSRAVWLPLDVTVTIKWRGMLFRNRHRYSDFQLFMVNTEQVERAKPAPPRSTRFR